MEKICKNCGNVMPEMAKFCPECGNSEFVEKANAAVEEAAVAAEAAAEEAKEAVEGTDTSSVTDALREEGDPSLALGMTGAAAEAVAEEAAADAAEAAVEEAKEAVDAVEAPSVADAAPVFSGQPVQQPYGQQPHLFGPQGNPDQPPHQYQNNINAAPQQPYGQQYPQQAPYGQPQYQQPYGAPYGQPYGAPAQKKPKKGLWIAIIAIVLVLGLAAVALFVWPGFLNKKGSPIDGEWTGEYGETMTIGDGRLSVNHGEGAVNTFEFTLDGDKLELTQITEMTFKVEGDTLTLTNVGEGEKYSIVATRVSGSGGIEGEWGDLRLVDEDGTTNDINGSTMKFEGGKYVSSQQYAADIEGEYSVSGDKIVIRNTSEKLNFTYTLEGDKLTLWKTGDNGEREKVEEYTRKGASGGDSPFNDPLKGRWIGEYSELLVFNGDGTGVFDGEPVTYVVNGETVKMTYDDQTVTYTFTIEDDVVYFYDEEGDKVEYFYREGAEPPAPRFTGEDVNGEWNFNIEDVDYSDMYDAMMATSIESTGASEAVKRILADESFKEALRPSITSLLSDYVFEFRDDGSVYMLIDAALYRDFMLKTQEAMIPLMREFSDEEAAEYVGLTVEELMQNLNNSGFSSWRQYVDEYVSPNLGITAQFDDATLEQMLGGTMNAYGEIETRAGAFKQTDDRVVVTGSAGDETTFVMDTDDLMSVESFVAPAGTSDAGMALLDAMEGLKFVRS